MEKIMEKAFFFNAGGTSEWRDVESDRNWVADGHMRVWVRYLFQNGDKKLHVFVINPPAKYKEIDGKLVEQEHFFHGAPHSHFMVWSNLGMFAADVLEEHLGIEEPLSEVLQGTDSGPIGTLGALYHTSQ